MAAMRVQREVLAGMLRSHGEDDLAARAESFGEDQLLRIGTLGAYYAWSEDALALGGGMGGARALSLATIDVVERSGRDLRRHHGEAEAGGGWSEEPDEIERARDRELRSHADQKQIPADESKRTLDTVDPPAWGPVPADATWPERRGHELRTKPRIDLTSEDLRFLIEHRVALNRLIPLALERLRSDAPGRADAHLSDLLTCVLRVDTTVWESMPDPDVSLRRLIDDPGRRFDLDAHAPELVEEFKQDHSARRRRFRSGLAE